MSTSRSISGFLLLNLIAPNEWAVSFLPKGGAGVSTDWNTQRLVKFLNDINCQGVAEGLNPSSKVLSLQRSYELDLVDLPLKVLQKYSLLP